VALIDLLTVGESFEDLIFVGLPYMPKSGEELRTRSFAATIGGGALITATAASRLGLTTTIISALSAKAATALRADGVRVVDVRRDGELHAITVSLSTAQERSFVTFNGVNDALETRLPAAIAGQRARHVHLAFAPRQCRRWTRIVERLRADGVTTSWDFGWSPALRAATGFRALLRAADFIFVNEAEAGLYARTARMNGAIAFWRSSTRNTIIKLGPRGSRWISDTIDVAAPAPRVRVVDTTGAGDAFNGGFLFGWLGQRPKRDCLRLGNFVGARSTLRAGGVAALPSRLPRSLAPAPESRPVSTVRRR
jgi:sugar/nucleoside kinase (ribokinase family)